MKTRKPLTALLLSVLALMMLLPTQALAAERIDLKKDVSLTISYQDGKTPLTGVPFDLYLVATVDSSGTLTPTKTFSRFNVDIQGKNDKAWRTLASTLEGFVLRDEIAPTDSGKTDKRGRASFPNRQDALEHGLYLVLGSRHTQDGYVYEPVPFLVMLPGLDQETDEWVYDVTVTPKYDADRIPDDSDTITRKVLKVWDDEGHEAARPKKVVVQLLRNGKIYDTVTLTAADNWRHTWRDLDRGYKWTVVEKELEDYTVEVTREGITFVVTNTYVEDSPDDPTPTDPPAPPIDPDNPVGPDQPTQPDNPVGPNNPTGPDNPVGPGNPTGPDNPTQPDQPSGPDNPVGPNNPTGPGGPTGPTLPQTGQLWWPVPVLLAAGLLLVVIGLLRRRGTDHEE